ncbi:PorT family protein [Paenimyroides tangerinum]|uniref:PorT family protein n=1 Tax=Paenimyroides tangerinum TaxID=2488728 RepID=A0A3P3W730_9FLAO|nr:porin family protein [Paenimyroides tangerinum]RRJ90981.1 PorT family protein [Paenimyroides tangerinum]
MKRIILLAIVLLGYSVNAQQEVKFGPKAGVNLSTLSNSPKAKMLIGFYVGVVAEIKFDDKFSIQPELIYSSQGAKYDYSVSLGNISGTIFQEKLEYINIPILAKYYISKGFSVEFGPQFGFLVKAESKGEVTVKGETFENNRDIKDEVNSFDFGIGAGFAYDLSNGFFINARYNFGITNVGKSNYNYQDSENGVAQIGVGYKF